MSQIPVTVFCSFSHQINIQEIIQTIRAKATVCALKNHHCEPAFIKLIWKLHRIFAKMLRSCNMIYNFSIATNIFYNFDHLNLIYMQFT